MYFIKKYFGLFLVICLSYWAMQPLFTPGFFPIHDNTQVARVYEMGKSLKDGMFPVRWVSDLGYGYGYPIFNFYAPLAYYVGGSLMLLGVDVLAATKAMIGIGVILAGVFMYFFAREFWGEMGGVVAAFFYVYAPYHAVQIYVRGAVGELWGYAFIPLLFYGVHSAVYKTEKWRWIVVGAIGFSGIMLSHNLTAIMVFPFLFIVALFCSWIAYKTKELHTIRYGVYAVILGLLLSAFYWIPAIFEMQYTNVQSQVGGGADFRDHFVCIQQLWYSNWGYGGSIPGCIDGLSFKIGKLHIIFSLLSFIGTFIFLKKEKSKRETIFLSMLLLFFSLVLTLEISRVFWEKISVMAYLQYPWRFLTFASFFSSFLAGAAVYIFFHASKQYVQKYPAPLLFVSIGIILIPLFSLYGKYFQPQTILSKTTQDYTNEIALKWVASKTSDEYMPKDFAKPKSQKEIMSKNRIQGLGITVLSYKEKTQEITARVHAKEDTILTLRVAEFPAWKVMLDNKQISLIKVKNGIDISFPQGEHLLQATFKQTPIEKSGNVISLIGVGVVLVGIIYPTKRHSI